MPLRLKPYKKTFDHTYSFGVFPTLELLDSQPGKLLSVLVSPRGEDSEGVRKLCKACDRRGVPVEVHGKAIDRLAPTGNCYAIGVLRKYECRLDRAANHVVLVNPSDMGNLGTIMRTMVAFGVAGLALVRPAADVFDPRVIRSSMGALGRVSFQYFNSFEDYRAACDPHPYPFLVDARALPLAEVAFDSPFALIFGNEAKGLGEEFLSIGAPVTIPHGPGVDSLNLPVAVGIALHHATRESFGKSEDSRP